MEQRYRTLDSNGTLSSQKKAEKSLKIRKEFYKKFPDKGIKNPEKDIKIVKDILW